MDECSNDGSAPSNAYNIRNDRAVSDHNLAHKFLASFVWQLPGAMHNALAHTIAAGWELNGIFNFQSGTPFTANSGVDNSQSAINADRANIERNPHLHRGRPHPANLPNISTSPTLTYH